MQTVRNAIAEMIRHSGKTIHAISQQSNIPETTIRNIVHGRSEDPRLSTIYAICRACGTTIEHLFRSLDEAQEPEDDLAAALEHLQRAIAARENPERREA